MSAQTHDMTRELGVAAAKITPPATVYALTLNEWVAIVTIVYVVLQTAYLLWKWFREWRGKAKAKS